MKKKASTINVRETRKSDALTLAELIYDMFKAEQQKSDKVEEGQSNAQPIETN